MKKILGTFSLHTETFRWPFFNNDRDILVIISRRKASRKSPSISDDWNGPEIFSLSRTLEISRQ